MHRRYFIQSGLGTALLSGASRVGAQNSTLRLMVPSPAGSVPDVTVRELAQRLARKIGQSFVVENKPGAGGILMAHELKRAVPDGRTIGATFFSYLSVSPSLYRTARFDPIEDFSHLGIYTHGYFLIAAAPESPVRSIADLLQMARQAPGEVNFGSAGMATPAHLLMSQFSHIAGITLNHVPFKSSTGVVQAGVNSEVPVISDGTQYLLPQAAAGKLRILAAMAPTRLPSLPQVPTLHELGIRGIDQPVWHGLIAPKGVPELVLARLSESLAEVCAEPDFKRWNENAGRQVEHVGPAAMRAQVQREVALWAREIARANIQVG